MVIARTDGEVGVLTADALKEMLGGHGSGKLLRVIQWMCWRCSRVALCCVKRLTVLASKTVPVRFLMVS